MLPTTQKDIFILKWAVGTNRKCHVETMKTNAPCLPQPVRTINVGQRFVIYVTILSMLYRALYLGNFDWGGGAPAMWGQFAMH